MTREITRLEFSGVEVMNEFFPDYIVKKYPIGIFTRIIKKANELGLSGKTVDLVEVQESFGTNEKYLDLITIPTPRSK